MTDNKLRDVLAYICRQYPHAGELSKARVTKMIYLADWRASLTLHQPLTGIAWKFNHYGPYVSDVVDLAREDPAFEVLETENAYGSKKELINLVSDHEPTSLTPAQRAVIDHVIESTSKLYWNDFISLVYSTYPIRTQARYATLDLISLADEYRSEQALAAG